MRATLLLLLLATAPASALVVPTPGETPIPNEYVGWAYEGDDKRLVVTFTHVDGAPAVPNLVECFVRTTPDARLIYACAPFVPDSHVVPLGIPAAANRMLMPSWPERHTITVIGHFADVQKPLVVEYDVIDVPGLVTDEAGVLVTPTPAPPTRTPLH